MVKIDKNKVIDRIKNRRIRMGLSYQNLADRTGLSKSTLQRYETGYIDKLSLQKLNVLAEALGSTPQYLLGLGKQALTDYCYGDNDITAENAIEFILTLKSINDLAGYNIRKLSEDEFDEFSRDILEQIKLVSYKYKR